MSKSINRVEIFGRLGKNPDIRYTQSGDAVCNLSVATESAWKDKKTGDRKVKTEWHKVIAFGKFADIAKDYLVKGSRILLYGHLQTRKWADKGGVDHYTTEIIVDDIFPIDRNEEVKSVVEEQQKSLQPAGSASPDNFDDDIPF